MALPAFYVDGINVEASDTCMLRGNTVSDLQADAKVVGIEVDGFTNLRAKNNKVVRLKSKTESIGFDIKNIGNTLLVYNVASRCDKGFVFTDVGTFNVYNLTSHNCSQHVISDTNALFRNIALSAYEDHKTYKNCIGFTLSAGVTLDIDYMFNFNISTLYNISTGVTEGSTILDLPIMYMDEPNDDLTPDHISELVNSGTANPLRTEDPCIGGIESEITDEITANRKYYYDLLDNSFWDVDNPIAAEVIFTKAFQSRILANSEVAEQSVERNMYIKTAESTQRFAELYPMYARYANQTKFKKRVADMWFSGQNPAAIQAYQNAIGGYNLFPSYFKRIEDIVDGWIIAESYINVDNWLLGMEGQKYGILIDVLGLSTLSQEASGECYTNTMNSVADIAPVRWNLHNEPEPDTYRLFTDLYNNFEQCALSNMVYNDDFNISPDVVQQDCQLTTPLISTIGIGASGVVYTATGAVSGAGELSTLDRIWSDNITRTMYYRLGESEATMGAWIEVEHPIGEIIGLTSSYIQFRLTVENVLRQGDYEFQGLCLRPYSSARIWLDQTELEEDMLYIELDSGAFTVHTGSSPAVAGNGGVEFANDGVAHNAYWSVYVPRALRILVTLPLRLVFSARIAGTAQVNLEFYSINELTGGFESRFVTSNITFGAPGPIGSDFQYVDIDLASLITINTTQLYVRMYRDSSVPADNLAANMGFSNGRAPYTA